MRGRTPPEELEYDPEIERTARRNNSKKKKEQDLAKQNQQEGSSNLIPSLTNLFEDTMAGIQQNPPEGNQNQNQNQSVMPCWTSPRRLAHLGKDKEKHNRSSAHRKSGILELGSSDANLAQTKILTQQLEDMKNQMKEMPKLIKEQLRKEQRHQQVHACEMCSSDHPTGYCPPQQEEEVNYVGNQQRPEQFQGQFPGNSNQQRFRITIIFRETTI